jgi:hypothetical protein
MPRILKTTMRDKNIINLSLKVSTLLGGANSRIQQTLRTKCQSSNVKKNTFVFWVYLDFRL